ncbi:MAG: hypothetical protein KKD01_04765 [Proteobacteria bacterium]|nr:hypothetical protein [Pseudomonadota bacterium]MBU1454020.1 hypothetical protein [Pseudomonadota bacterium]
MKKKTKTGLGCLFVILFFVLLIVLMSLFREEYDRFMGETKTQEIAWAPAMKICKDRYKSLDSPGRINVPNCKKRSENDLQHVFYWSKPMAIFIKKDPDVLTINSGTCVVSKDSGEIIYMTLNDRVIVGGK